MLLTSVDDTTETPISPPFDEGEGGTEKGVEGRTRQSTRMFPLISCKALNSCRRLIAS